MLRSIGKQSGESTVSIEEHLELGRQLDTYTAGSLCVDWWWYRCQCKGEESCADAVCPDGLKKRVVRHATGLPGSCCNTYDCVNGTCIQSTLEL